MLNLILFGPPGSGKGTQALKLCSRFNLLHISTGDIFRAEIKNQTMLGIEVKQYLDAGKLVPDALTIRVLNDFVQKSLDGEDGIIFDGFPRTIPQASALDEFLDLNNMPVTQVLSLEVDEEELIQRIVLRGASSGRVDDQDEKIVRKRLQVYYDQTSPLKDYYQSQGKLFPVNGMSSIEQVFSDLCVVIEN